MNQNWVELDNSQKNVTVMSYNILSPTLCSPENLPGRDTKYTSWEYRVGNLVNKIKNLNPDILCLQEFSLKFDNIIIDLGYEKYKYQYFGPGRKCGDAIFTKKDKIKILSHHHQKYSQNIQSFIMLELEILGTETKINIINTHLKAGRSCSDIRYSQISELLKYVDTLSNPVIVCGDMNAFPEQKEIADNLVSETSPLKYVYQITNDMFSLYSDRDENKLKYVDYILISKKTPFKLLKYLTSIKNPNLILPNEDEPSDHLPQMISIEL